MWAELFMANQMPLLAELDLFMTNLAAYREALASGDRETLCGLLREGREMKAAADRKDDET